MKIVLLLVLVPAALFALYVAGNLLFGFITQYNPPKEEALVAEGLSKPIQGNEFDLLIWNLGYGALGAGTDFFYDGGKTVITPREQVETYHEGILQEIKKASEADFILLQEVDQKSKRSWYIDQSAALRKTLPEHNSTYAVNYDVKNLPFPWTEPLGRILSGLQSFSRYMPLESKRISLPGITDFPRRLFYLKRCMLMQRFRLPSGKDLVIINTHFEAYDKGEVKRAQMKLASGILKEEYEKGNYVVIGGDWNIAPPDFNVHKFEKQPEDEPLYLANNDRNFMPGWAYAYDSTVATNRKNKTVFKADQTYTTVIDYYLVSPNLEVVEVKGVDLKFKYSDHQPVKLKIKLKE